jgi:hypothetical protein
MTEDIIELSEEDLAPGQFSESQKARIQEIVRERLGRAKAATETALEAQRTEFQKHLPGHKTDMTEYLDKQEKQRQVEDRERLELGKLFGSGSSGMQAQGLKHSDPQLYVQMRTRAIQLGLIADHNPAKPEGKLTNSFRKDALIHRYGEKL